MPNLNIHPAPLGGPFEESPHELTAQWLGSHLRKALREGSFEVHYQPLVTAKREAEAYEALVRFRHPKLGMVPPATVRYLSPTPAGAPLPAPRTTPTTAVPRSAVPKPTTAKAPATTTPVAKAAVAKPVGAKPATTAKPAPTTTTPARPTR